MVRAKGTVERIWTNKTQNGKRYNVLEINGIRYSLWDGEYFDKISQGQVIEFDFKESGQFKNIAQIYDGQGPEPEDGGDNGPNGNSKEYGGDRLDKMVKMSCLKSASNLLSGSKLPFEERASKAIDMARKFEEYVDSAEFDPDSL